MSEPVLAACGLEKSYGRGHTLLEVLRGADLELGQGELLAVVGPSGAGKSTLLHVLGGLDRADAGEVLYRGSELTKMWGGRLDAVRARVFGFVFQFYHLLREFTALENVLMPEMIRSSALTWLKNRRESRRRAEELLEELGLGERTAHRPAELSGGEQQRVAIARALVGEPEILLCDEPTGNLDAASSANIRELLRRLNESGQTMIIVTHEESLAEIADRTLEIREGRIYGG